LGRGLLALPPLYSTRIQFLLALGLVVSSVRLPHRLHPWQGCSLGAMVLLGSVHALAGMVAVRMRSGSSHWYQAPLPRRDGILAATAGRRVHHDCPPSGIVLLPLGAGRCRDAGLGGECGRLAPVPRVYSPAQYRPAG
jgi:hypothetical protein